MPTGDETFTRLETGRLLLRRFRPDDVDAFVAYRSDPDVARWQGWDAPYPLELGRRFIAELAGQHPDTPGAWFQFAIEHRGTGQLVGDCAAHTLAAEARQAEIGFTIATEHQGHGYATEGVRGLLGYLFGARAKHRVTATCDVRNARSAALLERVGMRREGQLVDNLWCKGEWTSEYVYALLCAEWHPPADGEVSWRALSNPRRSAPDRAEEVAEGQGDPGIER